MPLGQGPKELDKGSDRVSAIQSSGDDYTVELETIRNDLDAVNEQGTTLGTMVSSQLKLTEAETAYQVKSGIPMKASKTVKDAAGEVKRAAG